MADKNEPMHCGKKTLTFTVLGETVGQGRPRFSTHGGFVKAYDPKKSRDEKAAIRLIAQQAMQEQGWTYPSQDMPISIEIVSYRGCGKSKLRWFVEAANMGLVVPLNKPDADNCEKLYMDALSGVVYPDDKQVYRIYAVKKYAEQPRTEVTVTGYYLNLGEIKATANANIKRKKEMEKHEAQRKQR